MEEVKIRSRCDFKTRNLNFKTLITMQIKGNSLFFHKPRLDDVDAMTNCDLFYWFEFYNNKRPHSSFNGLTPEEVYYRSNYNDLNARNRTFAA